ncbi:hypothetical protein GB937_010569 [Aspergillus fischeri]|nr:hypothetical protein GB937_010569 [Aspergillus fischeri]
MTATKIGQLRGSPCCTAHLTLIFSPKKPLMNRPHIVEEIWKGNEFSGLHVIIEEQVAEDIDRMLEDDWRLSIDRGMKLGRFSAAFLLRIVKKKNDIFYTQRDQNVRQQFQIIDLKNSIKGYKQVIDELGKQMRVDAYDSDERYEF